VLLGEQDATAGRIKWGANLSIGYYDQRLDDFDPDASIIDEIRAGRPPAPEQQFRDLLAAMLFRGDDIYKPMRLLSGGERARVAFIELLLDEPNVLLMDEPTNHLDIASAEALESAVKNFPGTVLCVSHDRYFLDRVTDKLLVIDPPTIQEFDGRISAWLEKRRSLSAAESAPVRDRGKRTEATAQRVPVNTPRKDNPYKRRFGRLTVAQLEEKIHETELAIAACEEQFADPEVMRDQAKARDLHARHEELRGTLSELESEYFSRASA